MSDPLRPHGLYSPWNSPRQNARVGSLSLLQGIFPARGSNPGVLHCRRVLYQLNHKGSPLKGAHLSKPGFPSLGAVDIGGQVALYDGGVQFIVGCLTATLASMYWMTVAPIPPVVTTTNVSSRRTARNHREVNTRSFSVLR